MLGQMGQNFAAGMSGGVAYVLDLQEMLGTFEICSRKKPLFELAGILGAKWCMLKPLFGLSGFPNSVSIESPSSGSSATLGVSSLRRLRKRRKFEVDIISARDPLYLAASLYLLTCYVGILSVGLAKN